MFWRSPDHSRAPKNSLTFPTSPRLPPNPQPFSQLAIPDPKARCHELKSRLQARIGSSANRSPMGFPSLRRVQTRPATNIELTSLDCAAPSGFLNLLTLHSDHALSALFHADSVHGIRALRGFPPPVATTALTAACPSALNSALLGRSITPLRRASRWGFLGQLHLAATPKSSHSANL
jgi:hypothetical protein